MEASAFCSGSDHILQHVDMSLESGFPCYHHFGADHPVVAVFNGQDYYELAALFRSDDFR